MKKVMPTDKPKKKKPIKKEKAPDIFEKIEVKHSFNDAEKSDILGELTGKLREKDSLTDMAKSSAKGWKLKLEQAQLKVDELTNKAQDGFEMRPIEARVVMNKVKGRKTYFDKETGKQLSETDMTDADYERLPLEFPAPKVAPKPGEPIVNVGDAFKKAESPEEPGPDDAS